MRILQTAWDKVDIYTHVAKRCKVLAKVTYLLLLVVSRRRVRDVGQNHRLFCLGPP